MILCRLLGCYMPHAHLGQQDRQRCGAYCNDPDFCYGSVWMARNRVVEAYMRFVDWLPVRRCAHCRRWFVGRELWCSEACKEIWLPL
jgi:hypothetical protein